MSRLKRYVFVSVCLALLTGAAVEAAAATLSWDRSPELSVTGYRLSIGNTPGVYTQVIDVGNATTWTINLDAYKTYYFAVQAYDVLGQISPYSSEVARGAQASLVPDFGTVAGGVVGTADLLWQHDAGWLSVWYMNGSTLVDAAYLNPDSVSDANWRIVGAGDFDRDGKSDIVWHHRTAGHVVIWLMDGRNYRSSVVVRTESDVNWKIAAVGDMNGDWFPDFVWQHATNGNLRVWTMTGTSYQSSLQMSPGGIAVDTWQIVGAGDFNLDGSTDLLWQHKNGWLSVWFMSGVTMVDAQYLSPSGVNPIWKVVALSDYNSDGRVDIIFQRDDG